MLKIRRSHYRLIFNMEIAILGKDGLYIETGPRSDGLHTSGECSKLFSKCYQISTWKLVFSLSRVHNILSSWFTRPTSHSYPRCGQLTRHSLILANGLIRQSLTAVVHLCWNQWHKLKCDKTITQSRPLQCYPVVKCFLLWQWTGKMLSCIRGYI